MWLQLIIACDKPAITEQICTWLSDHALAVTLTDAADQPIYEPAIGSETIWDHARITALFSANTDVEIIATALNNQFDQSLTYKIEALEDKDWERAWIDDFKAMQFGQRTWICPSWQPVVDESAVNILLDPGLAFGTGTHPTTRLCLEWLDGAPLKDKVVIDYGSGSGILAIAAIKLGAKQAWAVDIDPQAITSTRNNASQNGISEDQLPAVLPEDLPAMTADIVIANILAKPLINLAEAMTSMLKSGGLIMLSGILEHQDAAIIQAYQTYCENLEIKHSDEWSGIAGIKR